MSIKYIVKYIMSYMMDYCKAIYCMFRCFCTSAERLELSMEKQGKIHILCNGPSLNQTIEKIQQIGGNIMMVNGGKKGLKDKVIPCDYYCFADHIYFGNGDYSEGAKESAKEDIACLNKCDDNCIVYVPSYATRISKKIIKKQIKGVYDLGYHFQHDNILFFLLKRNFCSPVFYSVAHMALYTAIQMGYKEIYLHGVDMSMFKDLTVRKDNVVIEKYAHFYNECYYAGAANMLTFARGGYENLYSFYAIRRYADAQNVKIINMSANSFVDCYEKYST